MSYLILPAGRQGYAGANLDLDAATGLIASLVRLDGTLTDTAVKAITGVTNASPAVITSNGHGFAQDDLLAILNVGGAVGVNQLAKVNSPAANTYQLKTTTGEALDVVTPGVYTSGGVAINLTKCLNRQDWDATEQKTYVIPTTTVVGGIVKPSASITFSAVAAAGGASVHAFLVAKNSGAAATDTGLYFYDGKQQVICNTNAAAAATTILVEPISQAIASGATIVFSNGVVATLTAPAAAGARSLTVSALSGAIPPGHTGEALINVANNLPIIMNGSDIAFSIDATNGLFLA